MLVPGASYHGQDKIKRPDARDAQPATGYWHQNYSLDFFWQPRLYLLALEDSMKSIYDLLRQKERQLELLAKQVEALRVTAQLMAEEEHLLGRTEESAAPSQPQMIREVLLEKNEPMHVRKITAAIREKYNKRLKETYLTSLIYRTMKKGKMFHKVEGKPNTFGLLEWQIAKTAALPLNPQKPLQ
jgi:hypothetical protein